MRELDLHGNTVQGAEQIFHQYLSESRLNETLIEVNFITGVGKIQTRLKELATEHGLYHYIPMNNNGCIVIEFE